MTQSEKIEEAYRWQINYDKQLKDLKTLSERCNQLLKDKGDLTDKVKELEKELTKKADTNHQLVEQMANLNEENAELKAKIYGGGYEAVITKKDADIILLEHSLKEQKELHKSVCDQLTHTHRNLGNQLTKAKELIKKLKALYLYPVVTKDDVKRQDEILAEAEQFLSEVEK